ncbi:MAG: FxLYD domain-containing protein [candidate division Zixibacteria bacterium]|nr:FxLYD domain-containing protein [candidate division Zixibacteria bacterium]
MRFTKVFLVVVLVCFLSQLALSEKPKKPRFPASTYKTTAKIFLKDEYRMYDSAIVILNEAVSFYSDDAELHFLLGKAYYLKNRPKEMGEQFTQAESLKIKSKFEKEIQQMKEEKWLQLFNQGATAFNEQNVDLALEKFSICTIIDPQDYRGFMNTGYAYSLKGENDKALSYLEDGLKLAPDSLEILKIYGATLYNAGKIKKALEVNLKVVEKDPKDASTLNNIVSIYGVLKDFDKALLFSQKLIDVDSSFEDAYFNMGTIYLQQLQEINFALDSLKDTTGAYRTEAKLDVQSWHWEKEGSFVVAEGLVKNISEEKLENVVAVFSVYDANGEFITSDNALIEYDPLLSGQTSPFKVMVKYNPAIEKGEIGFKHLLGEPISFRAKGGKEELEKKRSELFTKAERTLGKATELDTLDLEARLFLAQVYLQQEKLDQALVTLEFLVQKDSTNCEALVQLAAVYAKKGMDKAKETWQKAQDCLKIPLELQTWHWEKEGDFVVAEGLVKNISEEKLENVVAVFSVYDANGEFITSDNALIEYDPLLPEQTSPFKVMVKDNPAIEKGEIGFKHLLGGCINFRKKQE